MDEIFSMSQSDWVEAHKRRPPLLGSVIPVDAVEIDPVELWRGDEVCAARQWPPCQAERRVFIRGGTPTHIGEIWVTHDEGVLHFEHVVKDKIYRREVRDWLDYIHAWQRDNQPLAEMDAVAR